MKDKRKKIEINYLSLAFLLSELERLGIKPDEFENVFFKTDYTYCFYESDPPGVCAVFEKKAKK